MTFNVRWPPSYRQGPGLYSKNNRDTITRMKSFIFLDYIMDTSWKSHCIACISIFIPVPTPFAHQVTVMSTLVYVRFFFLSKFSYSLSHCNFIKKSYKLICLNTDQQNHKCKGLIKYPTQQTEKNGLDKAETWLVW